MSDAMTLTPESIEAIARRVAELLAPILNADHDRHPESIRAPTAPDLIDAAEVARRLGVDRGWVYENADRLGARRINDGPRSRLRFDPEHVVDAMAPRPFTAPSEPSRRQPRPRRQSSVELLPIGPRKAADDPS